MLKAVAPVLLALALASPASAGPEIGFGIARCHRVTIVVETLGYPGFTVCRSQQQ